MTAPSESPATVSRAQLYREVWTEPVRTVAQRYRVSDVALAKACRRHRIPVPGRGYWAKVRAGYRPPRLPLPRLKPGEQDQITIQGAVRSPEQVSQETARLIAGEKALERRIEVSDHIADPHPRVARAAKSLQSARPASGSSVLVARARPRLDLRVSEDTLDRGLRIMDALLTALEERDYQVEVDDEGKYSTSAIVLEERVFFFLEEKLRMVEHQPSPEERLRAARGGWEPWPRRESVPTGVLRLRIVDSDYLRVRTIWADGKRQRVENCLNAFVAGLLTAAEAIKRRRAERIEWERRQREEAAQRAERERLRWREEARARELMRQADAWEQVQRIRAYVERARGADVVYLPQDVEMETRTEWIEWASRYADELDPFRKREDGSI